MIRVLHVLGGLGTGGTETLIMNWYRAIDRSKYQFDFLVRSKDDNFIDEIHGLGGKVYYTSEFPRYFFRNYHEVSDILSRKHWDVIHVHANAAIYMVPLVLGKRHNIPCRIIHSHSVQSKNRIYDVIHYYNRWKMTKYSTRRLACSKKAGQWMFGKNSFEVLNNAIDIQNYRFSLKERERIRNNYDISEGFVIGHVGRFAKPKNHMFLIGVFERIYSINNRARLLLIGEGELEEKIRREVNKKGLQKAVIFAGKQECVGSYLSAMDAFVFPSLFEGLGNALVEAQINGLFCFASKEAISEEVIITSNVHSISLGESKDYWADIILNHSYNLLERDKYFTSGKPFDSAAIMEKLTGIYDSGGDIDG